MYIHTEDYYTIPAAIISEKTDTNKWVIYEEIILTVRNHKVTSHAVFLWAFQYECE